MAEDLTTVDAVKAFLGGGAPGQAPTDDKLLADLVRHASNLIRTFTTVPSFRSRVYTESYDGLGGDRLMLRQTPISSVSALAVQGASIPATSWPSSAGYPQSGFIVDPWDGRPPGNQQLITLYGYCFPRGRGNVRVTYTAGFLTAGEAQTVPTAGAPLSVSAPWGPWVEDAGVVRASSGAALTLVPGSTPAAGQYALRADVPGDYLFNAADAGLAVLISYSYTPSDVEMSCRGLVAELYRYSRRVGEQSKSVGGQTTVSYKLTDIPAHIKLALNPYERIVPL